MTKPAASHRFARSLITLGLTVAAIRTADNMIEFVANLQDSTISWMLPRLRERADVVVLDPGGSWMLRGF